MVVLLSVQPEAFALVGSLLLGAAVGVFTWWVVAALQTDDLQQKEDEWRFDISRINGLRRADLFFRLFQPLIQFFAKLNRAAFAGQLPEVLREIQAGGLSRFWLPEEYLAKCELIALMLLPVYAYVCFTWMGPAGLVTAVVLCGVTAWYLRRRLTQLARRRLMTIKRRLPFLLDLLTLLMEAGSSFLNALGQAVVEFEGHPVATEFGRVLTDMNMGKARTEAFENMRSRLNDDEIGSIVGSIIQAEQLGTPLSNIFRTQADVLRTKRSQRAETIAGEAGVNMLLPGVLVMAATILVILGPFLLNFLDSGLGF
ncbi:MAG: type II secretion system F family protein [Pirellulaceae bacterium]